MHNRLPSPGCTVSVVVTCYNQARFVAEAIDSATRQDYPLREVVLVDDGSDDNTAESVARLASVGYVRQDNRGLSAARNTGLHQSTGEYILFLDADDRLHPGAVSAGVAELEANRECGLVYGGFREITVDGALLHTCVRPALEEDPYVALLRRNHIGMHATVMYRRKVLLDIGGFDESLNACEDYDVLLRVARAFPIRGHREVIADYRRHDGSMSQDLARMLRASLRVLERQRDYARVDQARLKAYRAGLSAWRAYYGRPLRHQAFEHLRRQGERLKGVRQLLTVARYAPLELLGDWGASPGGLWSHQ
jgi:GT2 family glycosyltransferase